MNEKNYYNLSSRLLLPYLETNRECLKEIFNILVLNFSLKKGSKQKFIDLGSGDGRVVIFCTENYEIESHGIEIDKNMHQQAKRNLNKLKKDKKNRFKNLRQVKLEQADLFERNLSDFDYIFIFSFPPMQKYLRHVFKTAKKGAIIISYGYELNSFADILNLRNTSTFKQKKENVSIFFYEKI